MEQSTGLIRDEIYRSLRAQILSCALGPGIDLHENELAKRFAVSKSPIRDALMRLEAERLVTVRPRKGYRVAPISVTDAREIFAFRSLMEQTCAQSAAACATDAELKSLDRFRSLEAWGESDDFVTYNRTFHLAIVDLCGNRRIVTVARDLIEHFDRFVVISVAALVPRNVEVLIAEHVAVINALQAREGRRATKILGQHISRAERRVIAGLERVAIVP